MLLSLCCFQYPLNLLQDMNHNAKEEHLPNEKSDTHVNVLQARDVAVIESRPELIDALENVSSIKKGIKETYLAVHSTVNTCPLAINSAPAEATMGHAQMTTHKATT